MLSTEIAAVLYHAKLASSVLKEEPEQCTELIQLLSGVWLDFIWLLVCLFLFYGIGGVGMQL